MVAESRATPVLLCPVCGAEHTPLALRCASCGAFLRDRVPALHLFPMLYMLIERPREAFLRIARSEQKNYLVTLACAAGPALLAAVLYLARIGDTPADFLLILALLVVGGPVAGLLLLALVSLVLCWPGAALMRVPPSFRMASAFAAYAASPFAYVSVILLPLMLGMFGTFLFGSNPSPAQLKPLSFRVFVVLAACCALWSFILTVRSFTVQGVPWRRSGEAAAVAWGVAAALITAAGLILRAALQA